MKSAWLVLALVAGNAFADGDESLVEQLLQHRAAVAATKTAPARSVKPDPAVALVGQPVRIHTVDHGLYLGTLTAVDTGVVHLDIVSGGQTLSYALPRMAVAQIEPVAAP